MAQESEKKPVKVSRMRRPYALVCRAGILSQITVCWLRGERPCRPKPRRFAPKQQGTLSGGNHEGGVMQHAFTSFQQVLCHHEGWIC